MLRSRETFARSTSSLGVRRVTFKSVVREVIRDLPTNRLLLRMGNFIRAVMRDEFEHTIRPRMELVVREQLEQLLPALRVQPHRTWPQVPTRPLRSESPPSPLKLRFVNSPSTVYTDTRIEAENGSEIEIELTDVTKGSRVVSEPLSSQKVEIVVLNGGFNQEDWHEDEFARNIVPLRDDRQQLLKGDLTIVLKEGRGVLSKSLVFTYGSCRSACRKFRLGAQITQRGSSDVKVKPARSEAFTVKVYRSKEYQKHHPPSPDDKVFRLEKIGKNGIYHSRLVENEIHTVKDLLRQHVIDPKFLRTILGNGKEIPDKTWNSLIEHARECKLDENKCYVYTRAADGTRLLLNSVYEVIGASFGVPDFKPFGELRSYEQSVVEEIKQQAYNNLSNLVPTDKRSILDPSRPFSGFEHDPGRAVALNLSQDVLLHAHRDQPEGSVGFSELAASTLCNGGAEHSQQTRLSAFQYGNTMQIPHNLAYDVLASSSQNLNKPSCCFINRGGADTQQPSPLPWSITLPVVSTLAGPSQSQASTSHCCEVNDRQIPVCPISLPLNHASDMLIPALRRSFGALDEITRGASNAGSYVFAEQSMSNEDEITLPVPCPTFLAGAEFSNHGMGGDFGFDALVPDSLDPGGT